MDPGFLDRRFLVAQARSRCFSDRLHHVLELDELDQYIQLQNERTAWQSHSRHVLYAGGEGQLPQRAAPGGV